MPESTVRRIAYLGNFRPSFSTETHLANSFEDLGIAVKRLQEDESDADSVLAECADCDLLVYTHTWGLRGDGHGMLKRLQIPSVSWHLDLYAGLDRETFIFYSPFWKTDHVFSPDGGHDDFFGKHGINHHHLSPGVYAKECCLLEASPELECDVAFVGSYDYLAEWPYRRTLIDWLRANYGSRFRLFGQNFPVRGRLLNQVYASAKVVVGDSLYSPNYWSDRLPETLGRGGFLVFPFVDGIEAEYKPGEHFVSYHYGDFEGLKSRIDYYLEHPEEREAIRRAGHEWVKQHHTYTLKCRRVLETVGASHAQPRILNLGCGRYPEANAVNLDLTPGYADVVHDLNRFPYPFPDAEFDRIVARDVLEHLDDIVGVMQECHRILKPGGVLWIRTNYAKYPSAFIDPTHRHFFMPESFDYFDPSTFLGREYGFYSKARFAKESWREFNEGLEFTLRKQ